MSKTKVNVRQFIVAPPKKVLLCADYSGQELRVLAHVAKEPTMIDAFLKNQDVHLFVANDFYNLGILHEQLITDNVEYPKVKSKFKLERDNIKTVNFGLVFGKTKYGFAADFGWSVKKAEKFVNDYFERFPKIKDAIDKCNKLVYKQKAIRNLTGRIRRFDHVDNRVLRQAFNFLIQSVGADLMKIGAGYIHNLSLLHSQWDCRLVLTVHDELVYELYEEYIDEALPLIKHELERVGETFNLQVPMIVDINYGLTYSEAK